MAPQIRRSSRLKAKECSSSVIKDNECDKTAENRDGLDLENLVSQSCDFMVSKLADLRKNRKNSESCQANYIPMNDTTQELELPYTVQYTTTEPTQLSSELLPEYQASNLYLNLDRPSIQQPLQCDLEKLMKKSVITPDFEKRHTAPPMYLSANTRTQLKQLAKQQSAGPKWFNLPATELTPEIEHDLKILKLRNVLDRKRHYKKNDTKNLPKYFQIGTVVEGAAEFYSSRILNRDRKSTIVNELLADAEFRRYNKKKFLEIQATKQSGKKGFYRKKMNRRKPNWARK